MNRSESSDRTWKGCKCHGDGPRLRTDQGPFLLKPNRSHHWTSGLMFAPFWASWQVKRGAPVHVGAPPAGKVAVHLGNVNAGRLGRNSQQVVNPRLEGSEMAGGAIYQEQ